MTTPNSQTIAGCKGANNEGNRYATAENKTAHTGNRLVRLLNMSE